MYCLGKQNTTIKKSQGLGFQIAGQTTKCNQNISMIVDVVMSADCRPS
jgi:hypothetical protein